MISPLCELHGAKITECVSLPYLVARLGACLNYVRQDSDLLDVRLIFQKPAHFLSAHMALVNTFFQMFIVLGMYITLHLPTNNEGQKS